MPRLLSNLGGGGGGSGSSDFRVLIHDGDYPERPDVETNPAGTVMYLGPSQPTDWLTGDQWVDNS